MENALITGGTGLIGSRLTHLLLKDGYSVSHLSRGETNLSGSLKTYHWNIERGELDVAAIKNADHIIHLAGASIAGGRWTKARKEELYRSRILSTRLLLNKLKELNHPLQTFISASAVGYYGDGKDSWLAEDSPNGKDFLARLCNDWEAEAMQINVPGIRTVIFRTGIVLAREGGALPELSRPINLGIAIYMGNGEQYLSWIHIDDLCRAYLFALKNESMKGVYNAVAPEPVTNREMVETIKEIKKSRALTVPAPAFALKLALGEMSTALLTGQRCSSERLQKAGFEFKSASLKDALHALL